MQTWFSGWDDIARVLVSGGVTFVALLVSIRIGGNRVLSTMNASDFVITVAIGTTFATSMLSAEVSIASGVAAIATLIGLQVLTMWVSVRWPRLRHQAEGEPLLLLRDGSPRLDTMKRAHVSMDELKQAVRQQGFGGFDSIAIVFLEANGKFSVIPNSNLHGATAVHEARRRTMRD